MLNEQERWQIECDARTVRDYAAIKFLEDELNTIDDALRGCKEGYNE